MKRKRLWLMAPVLLALVLVVGISVARASLASTYEKKLRKLSSANRIEMREATWTGVFPLNARQVQEVVSYSSHFKKTKWPQRQKWTHFTLNFYAGKRLLGSLECAPICPGGCTGANHGSSARTIFVDGYELQSDKGLALIRLLSSQNGDA